MSLRERFRERRGAQRLALALCLTVPALAWASACLFEARVGRAASPVEAASSGSAAALPKIMLWAWERPEDLRFLSTQEVGVAFLAGTIEIQPAEEVNPGERSRAVLLPRRQPLEVPPGTALMAVVRIETPHDLWHEPPGQDDTPAPAGRTPLYSPAERNQVAGMIASLARLEGVRAVQVDYDAAKSEQSFYRLLLESVRRRLPRGMPLSMTALASWCLGDHWLASLPLGTVSEAVPMLFRMGPDGPGISAYWEAGGQFRVPACRTSLGLSTDEAFSQELLRAGALREMGAGGSVRVYVFSDRSWTRAGVQKIVAEVNRWDSASLDSR